MHVKIFFSLKAYSLTVKSRIEAQGLYPEKGLFWWAYIQVGLYPAGLYSGGSISGSTFI